MGKFQTGGYDLSDFDLDFDLSAYQKLDRFAVLCCQEYNFGNETDWFGCFRGGHYGSRARIYGVKTHYLVAHSWVPQKRLLAEIEYHLASILFNMDSAVECLTYALNAIGYCVSGKHGFRDVTKANELRLVSPRDVTGGWGADPVAPGVPGYGVFFPSVRRLWQDSVEMLATVFDLHNVSKHRQTIYRGGAHRLDPPPGFYESLGIGNSPEEQALYWPMKEIILEHDPKIPRKGREPQSTEDRRLLEELVLEFRDFIEETGVRALNDAREKIELKVGQFKRP